MPRLFPLWIAVPLGLACNSQKAIHVAGALAVSPTALDFHVVAVGMSAQLDVTVSSQTTTAVQIHGATLSGFGATAFSVSAPPATVSGQAVLHVGFAPTTAQSYSATLTISSSDPDHPNLTVSLAGVGAKEHVQVQAQVVDGGVGRVVGDAGLGLDFGTDTWGAAPPPWPNLLLENLGGAPAVLTGFHFDSDAGPFFFPEPPVVPQTIAAQQTRVLPIGFQPPSGGTATSYSGSVTLTFDDPALPSAVIQLSGTAEVVPPPSLCSGMLSAQELDGSIEVPTSFGKLVPVEPGSQLQLSAFADDLADAGPNPCTSDSAFGRGSLLYQWSVAQAPAGSTAAPSQPSGPRTAFVPDLVGHYSLRLAVTDPMGRAGTPASAGSDQISFDAAPLEDLTVIAAWPGFAGVDLDLHFVRPGSVPFDPVGDLCALSASGSHGWSASGDPTANPHFGGDDQGNGKLTERAWLNHPDESCQADGGCLFGLWVHYYQDNRSLAGAASCTLPGCTEGTACGCSAGLACEPNLSGPGACASEVAPVAQVFFRGQLVPALAVPLTGDGVLLPSPCFMWHAADIVWTPDGGVARADGDGGTDSYWGAHTDETRQCSPSDGGWAQRAPPVFP